MIQELIKAFMLIFIAEMGDKTQILAMAFATRYPVKKVLLGIFIGSFLNHGLAVILGSYISNFVPINTLQIIAGFAFVGFSLWTLKPEAEEEEEEKQKLKAGPVVTVAIAFFIGELGDKTQLTAITLATDAIYPLAILCGTVLGMIATGGIGIIVGKKLGDKIPEFAIKIIAASVFMLFGVTKLYQTLPTEYLSVRNIVLFTVIVGAAASILLRAVIIERRKGIESAFAKRSRELYNYYHQMDKCLDNICSGPESCGEENCKCCIIEHTRALVRNGLSEKEAAILQGFSVRRGEFEKYIDKVQALESLRVTLKFIKSNHMHKDDKNINAIRKNLELLIFGKSVESIDDWSDYANKLTDINNEIALSILKDV